MKLQNSLTPTMLGLALALVTTTTAIAGDPDRRGFGHKFHSPSAKSTSLAAAAARASAKASSRSASQAGAYSGGNRQSTSYNNQEAASSAHAPSVVTAGECNVGFGLGSSIVEGALSVGINWKHTPCVIQNEAAQLWNMGYDDAAILHLAKYHKRMGHTLRNAGVVK